jgi:hypothetical protein
MDNIGIVEYADNYEEKLKHALQKMPMYVEEKLAEKEKEKTVGAPDDDDSSGSFGLDEGLKPVFKTESPTQRYAPLLKALGKCPALNLGFHTKGKKLCFCPFGYKMRKWHEKYNIPNEGLCSGKGDKKGSTQGFLPYGLVSHLRDKAVHDMNHAIVLEFLKCLYDNYTVPGHRHKDF